MERGREREVGRERSGEIEMGVLGLPMHQQESNNTRFIVFTFDEQPAILHFAATVHPRQVRVVELHRAIWKEGRAAECTSFEVSLENKNRQSSQACLFVFIQRKRDCNSNKPSFQPHRQTHRHRHRHRHKDTGTHRHRHRHRHKDTDTQTSTFSISLPFVCKRTVASADLDLFRLHADAGELRRHGDEVHDASVHVAVDA